MSSQQPQLVIADSITACAALCSTFGWIAGYVPGVISGAVGIVAFIWYTIQILDSRYYKRWKMRRHAYKK